MYFCHWLPTSDWNMQIRKPSYPFYLANYNSTLPLLIIIIYIMRHHLLCSSVIYWLQSNRLETCWFTVPSSPIRVHLSRTPLKHKYFHSSKKNGLNKSSISTSACPLSPNSQIKLLNHLPFHQLIFRIVLFQCVIGHESENSRVNTAHGRVSPSVQVSIQPCHFMSSL